MNANECHNAKPKTDHLIYLKCLSHTHARFISFTISIRIASQQLNFTSNTLFYLNQIFYANINNFELYFVLGFCEFKYKPDRQCEYDSERWTIRASVECYTECSLFTVQWVQRNELSLVHCTAPCDIYSPLKCRWSHKEALFICDLFLICN